MFPISEISTKTTKKISRLVQVAVTFRMTFYNGFGTFPRVFWFQLFAFLWERNQDIPVEKLQFSCLFKILPS